MMSPGNTLLLPRDWLLSSAASQTEKRNQAFPRIESENQFPFFKAGRNKKEGRKAQESSDRLCGEHWICLFSSPSGSDWPDNLICPGDLAEANSNSFIQS